MFDTFKFELRYWLTEHHLFPKTLEYYILCILYRLNVPLSDLNRVRMLRYRNVRREKKIKKLQKKIQNLKKPFKPIH